MGYLATQYKNLTFKFLLVKKLIVLKISLSVKPPRLHIIFFLVFLYCDAKCSKNGQSSAEQLATFRYLKSFDFNILFIEISSKGVQIKSNFFLQN